MLRSALTTGSLGEGVVQGWENQSLPLSSLGDHEDKNIYGQFSSLWGQAGHRMGCFSLATADLSGWQEPRQTQAVYRACRSPGDSRSQTVSPLQRGREPLDSRPEEQGWVSVLCWFSSWWSWRRFFSPRDGGSVFW